MSSRFNEKANSENKEPTVTLISTIRRYCLPLAACALAACSLLPGLPVGAATVGWNQSAAGTYDYNDPGNWVGGDINGIWDLSNTIPSSQTITFAADTILSTGFLFEYDGSAQELLRGTGADRTITLGGDIVHNTNSNTRAITFGSNTTNQALNVDLGGVARTFTVGSGRTLGFVNAISNGSLITSGGTLNFSGANTYFGTTTINSGVFSLNGTTGSSANSDFTVQAGDGSPSTLTFNSNSGSGITRAMSVTLNGAGSANGASFNVVGNSGANTIDTITNALTASAGFAQVTVTANAAKNARLEAGSFARNAGATVLFRGSTLGASTIASQTAGNANVQFDLAPTLVGAGGAAGTSTVSILKGAYGDTLSNGDGFSATGGLVTYDATSGVRVLGASEYQSSIADGQTALDNIRLVNNSGTGATVTLNLNTTVNSLSLNVGDEDSSITLSGTGTLILNSGTLYAWSASPADNGAEMTLNNTIDLNGGEGVFLFDTAGSSQGTGGARLQITGAVTNDGGQGVTFGSGGGVLEFSGTESNTYTGATTVNNGGLVRLAKAGGGISIAGNLVINGGVVQNTGDDVADTSDIIIHGGTYTQKGGALNSGSGASETFHDLLMTGGSYGDGASGTSSGATNLNNASLSGGNWSISRGHKTTLGGGLTLTGGEVNISRAQDLSRNTIMTLTSNLNISNTADTLYTPLTLGGGIGAGVAGGRLVMNGNLGFTGNSTNSNAVTIDATATDSGGLAAQIWLEGTRTFNIGNGAAAVDLAIRPDLVNGSTTGGLIKTGTGSLSLAGTNTYTGATVVSAGTLLVDGALQGTSGVSVAAHAHFGGSGAVFTTVGGAGSIDPGDSPGILTVTQVDPSAGLDFNFEFTQANAMPNWAATENDVLRIMDGTPFTQTLDFNNTISLYLDTDSLSFGDVLTGGFYTDGGDPLSDLALADVVAYAEAANGSISYLGKLYNPITSGHFTLGTLANSQFAAGGYLTQFTFVANPAPEPSSALLLGLGVVLFGSFRRKRRQK
jgi:autotransporter-associated beta strand protein